MYPATSVRARWAAIGAAVAVTVGAGIAATDFVDATVTSGERTVLIAITPCRLFDTRPEFQVGPKSTPLGAGETFTVSGRGAVGNCTIPADASALSLNVTAVGATLPTFLTIWPTGAGRPTASSLNPAPDTPPAPNAVTTDLSGDGRFNVYNLQGQVHVLADVVGYYAHHTHDDLYYTQAQVDAELAGLRAEIDALEGGINALNAKLADVHIGLVDGHKTLRFNGVNVQIVDGTNNTQCGISGFEACNGLGNLIIGYHEDPGLPETRSGSHNLVTGADNDYTSYAGIIAGYENTTTGPYATITGGTSNTADGRYSSVTGGRNNDANSTWSSISGGRSNHADGAYSSVAGGQLNTAEGESSSVTGGYDNTASGDYSSVAGGYLSRAAGEYSSVAGGNLSRAAGEYSSVAGGYLGTANGYMSTVTGGYDNDADGDYSSVSGGFERSVSGYSDWRAGSLFDEG